MQTLYNHVSKNSKSKCAKKHSPYTPATKDTDKKLKCEFPNCNGRFSHEKSRKSHYNNIHNYSVKNKAHMNNGRPNLQTCKPRNLKEPTAKERKTKKGKHNSKFINNLFL